MPNYPKVNYPDFSNSRVVTSYDFARIYDEPHEVIMELIETIYATIERMIEEDPDRYRFIQDHGIFPTVRDGVKYFELNRNGFEHCTLHAPDGKADKWQRMYMHFIGFDFDPGRGHKTTTETAPAV